jgi:hypothetical protein
MAQQDLNGTIITPAICSVNNQRVADATDGDWSVNSGQAMAIADGGIAFTKGRVTCDMSINTLIPRAGMKVDLISLVTGQVQVTMKLLINAQWVTFYGIVETAKGSWSFADGKMTGAFTFKGANIQQTAA